MVVTGVWHLCSIPPYFLCVFLNDRGWKDRKYISQTPLQLELGMDCYDEFPGCGRWRQSAGCLPVASAALPVAVSAAWLSVKLQPSSVMLRSNCDFTTTGQQPDDVTLNSIFRQRPLGPHFLSRSGNLLLWANLVLFWVQLALPDGPSIL